MVHKFSLPESLEYSSLTVQEACPPTPQLRHLLLRLPPLFSGTNPAHTPTTLRRCPKDCDRIRADFGGTEILPVIERRLHDLNLKILGQMWNSEDEEKKMLEVINKNNKLRNVRICSVWVPGMT